MLTAELIRGLAPHAHETYVDALVNGAPTLQKWGFTTDLRLAALLATILHETGKLTILRENGNYSAERLREVWPDHFTAKTAKTYAHQPEKLFNYIYGPGTSIGRDLGNTQPGDGWRFRGGGMAQTTGRDNYTRLGLAIGADLANHPELIELGNISLQGACWEISRFMNYCDLGERGFRAVSNGVNCGNPGATRAPVGWSDRQTRYKSVCSALGVNGVVSTPSVYHGEQSTQVLAIQQRLIGLGYAPGSADGVFGSRTRQAVLGFQAEHNLPLTGIADPQTVDAMNSAQAKPMPVGDRATATVDDLRKAGSETIAHADSIKAVAGALGTVSAITGGADVAGTAATPAPTPPVDLIATTRDVLTEVGGWKSIVTSMSDTFHWATSHGWVLGIVLAFAFYKWGNQIQWRRLLDHRNGANTSR
jgi:putative chitinase